MTHVHLTQGQMVNLANEIIPRMATDKVIKTADGRMQFGKLGKEDIALIWEATDGVDVLHQVISLEFVFTVA